MVSSAHIPRVESFEYAKERKKARPISTECPPTAFSKMLFVGRDATHAYYDDGIGDIYLRSLKDRTVSRGFPVEQLTNFDFAPSDYGKELLKHIIEMKEAMR